MRSFSGDIHYLNKAQHQSFMIFQRQLYTCRFLLARLFLTHVQSINWYKVDVMSNLHFYLFFCFLLDAQLTLPPLRSIFRQTSIVAGYQKGPSGSSLLRTGPFEAHLEVMESSWVVSLFLFIFMCV